MIYFSIVTFFCYYFYHYNDKTYVKFNVDHKHYNAKSHVKFNLDHKH